MTERPPPVVTASAAADGPGAVNAGASGGRSSLTRGAGLVTPSLTLLNVAGYVLAVAASRAFSKDAYGELSALLGALLVASVPALAVQAVVARSLALRPPAEPRGPRERALLLRAGTGGLLVALVVAAAAPALAAFLHTGVAGPLWLAAQLAPYGVLCAAMGALQGTERFGALAVVIVAQAVAKGLGVVPLLVGGDPAAVLATMAGGMLLAALLAVLLVRVGRHGPKAAHLPGARDVVGAAGGLLALLALANLDLLLARHLLPGAESGRYSAGAVLARAAFWLPQAVAVVVFARLSDEEGGRVVLRRSVLVVTALGLVEVAGSALLAAPVLRLTFGSDYASIAGIAPLWVLQGAALAVVQLLLYRSIALRDPVTGCVLAGAVVLEAAVILALRPSTSAPVITVAAVTAVLLSVGLLARSRRTPGTPAQT
ncbi:MAG: polysaccharide biosynthesis protein [Mycobacteriales bacterium]